MRKYNVIVVYDMKEENILCCYRIKKPYKGLYNLIGGKIEEGEDGLTSAYRELVEETGITSASIDLTFLMSFYYPLSETKLQVYAGKLHKEVELVDEVHPLIWMSVKENYFDCSKFAGEGNIGHMLEQVKLYKEKIFKKQ